MGVSFGAGARANEALDQTFARMDAVAGTFKGLTGNFKQVKHLELLNDNETSMGKITVKRNSRKDVRSLMEFAPPDEKSAFFGGSKAQLYYPKMNLVQEWDLGNAATMRDQLMLLAFGSNSREITAAYTVSLGGPDTVAGQKATRLVLIPKNPDILKMFPRIEMWVSDETGLAVQQKMHEGGGDFIMATYSDLKLTNPPDSAVKLNIPKNAKVERPQK